MTSKKTNKNDKNTKSSSGKSANAKSEKSLDVKKPSSVKPTVAKEGKSSDVKKPVASKATAAKSEKSSDVKKSSPEKNMATKTKKPSDDKKLTQPKTDKSIPAAKAVKGAPSKPNADEAMHLATQSMNHFIVSKQEKSMEHFFHTVAKVWQDMTTVDKLNTAFASIIADNSDWTFLKEIWPTLIKDGLSDRGDWVVVGVYPTKPKKLIFDQIFVHEDGEWKLAELKLYTAD